MTKQSYLAASQLVDQFAALLVNAMICDDMLGDVGVWDETRGCNAMMSDVLMCDV